MPTSEVETPLVARQFSKVLQILASFNHDPAKLVSILQAVQEEYRYLPEEVMTFVATSLDISPARVYGVATFYSHFTLEPKGKYVIKVCDGTACHVKGSTELVDTIKERLKLPKGKKTTPDMLFTLETVSCLGACGLAPAVVVNEDVHGQMTAESTRQLLDGIFAQEGIVAQEER